MPDENINEEVKTVKEYMVTVYMELIGKFSGNIPTEATLRRQIRTSAEDKGRLVVEKYKFDLDNLRKPCECEGDDD